MGGRYLTGLAGWLREAGLSVQEYPGWQDRARSSGGYADGRPWCVMWHHTASQTSLENDAAYCAEGDPDAPICNVLIGRDGTVAVIAAGATNTNGKGYAMSFSRGTVPDDSMNTYAVGVEICNNGIGEPYPAEQIDAALITSLTICARCGLAATDVAQHVDWAPDRKIDPATAAAVQGAWRPRAINGSGSWALEDLRAELAARAGTDTGGGGGPPPPLAEGDDMLTVALDANGTAWKGDGIKRIPIGSDAEFQRLILVHRGRLLNVSGGTVGGWDDVGGPVDADTLTALGNP